MSDNNLDQIVEQYLSRLNVALADIRPERREQLMESIIDHISEARSALSADSEVALRDILDRVGQPEDIAAEALGDQTESPVLRLRRIRRWVVIAVVAVVVVAGLRLGISLIATNDNASPGISATTSTSATISIPVTVPNVIGEPSASAQNQLTSERLLFEVEYVCSKIHLPPGVVTSQSPTAGTRTRTGSPVILTVSTRKTCP